MSQQSSALPPPPGMTRPSPTNRISPQSLAGESRSPNLQQQSLAEPHRSLAPPSLEPRPDSFTNQTRVNGASPVSGLGRQPHAPGPIAPPSRAQQQPQETVQRQGLLGTWKQDAQKPTDQHKSDADAEEKKQKESIPSAPPNVTFKETFKQTSVDQGGLGGPRRYAKTEYTIHDAEGSRSVQSITPAPPKTQTQPSGPSPVQQDPWKAAAENTVRIPNGSLNPAHGGLGAQPSPIAPPHARQPPGLASQGNANHPADIPATPADAQDGSPPPPETSSHPVHSGNTGHPLVKLPMKPIVKLPPAAPSTPQQTPVMIPHRPVSNWGPPGSARPLVMQEAWQARFNGLFNRTPIQTETPPSPPKTPPKMQGPAPPIAASSRTTMDEAPTASNATVSLPQTKKVTSAEGFTIDDSDDIISKGTIEQMFTDELSFGSLPKISIPRNPRYDNEVYHSVPRNTSATGLDSKPETVSATEINMMDVHPKRRDGCYIHLPQLKLVRRLIRYDSGGNSRKSSTFTTQDRKPSGRFNNKAKGKETTPTPSSPATTSTPSNIGSRKASSAQKGPTPVSDSPAAATSPAARMEVGKKSSWAKPPKGPPRRPQTVNKPT